MNKKILHISYGGLGNGGVSSVILAITESLCDKFEFGCVVFAKHLRREEVFKKYGKLHRINVYGSHNVFSKLLELILRPFRLILGVFCICRSNKYDIVHCHNGADSCFCLIGAWLAGVDKRIVHAHNPKGRGLSFLSRIYTAVSDYLIQCLSTNQIGCSEQTCVTNFRKDYQVVNNAIDLTEFTYNEIHSKEHVKLIHVGRFDYQKNQEFVLDILAELVKIRSDISLSLVGFGVNEQMLRKKVEQLQLEQYVSFVDGTKADVAQLFHDSDYMIFPSRFEGFGIVLLEAQASGVYCFVSDAVQDVTNVGLWEKISLDDSAETWANKLLYRIEHGYDVTKEDVLQRLQQFDIKEIAKQYAEIYNE